MRGVRALIALLAFLLASLLGGAWATASSSEVTEVVVEPSPSPAPTLTRVFFARVGGSDIAPSFEVVKLSPIEKDVIIGNSFDVGSVSSKEFPALPAPSFGMMVRPPCQVGKMAVLTGYNFFWQPGMSWRTPGYHPGVDVRCVSPDQPKNFQDGEPVLAPLPGVVWKKGYIDPSTTESIEDWVSGNTCIVMSIIDGYKIVTVAGHFQNEAPNDLVRCPDVGQPVTYDTYLGRIGSTGKSTGPHLHLGFFIFIDEDWYWINPADFGILNTVRRQVDPSAQYGGALCDTPVQASVDMARAAAIAEGISVEDFLPLIFSESSFKPCYPDGRLLDNVLDARCMGQIIPVHHPDYDPERLLTDIPYCFMASAKIFREYTEYTGSPEGAVARYKHAGPGTPEYQVYLNAKLAGFFPDLLTGAHISLK